MSIDRASKLVRPLRGGQITIPAEFRRKLGITEDTMLRVTLEDEGLRLTPVRMETAEARAGSQWLRELYEYYAPVRDEILASGASEEEVNADIDAAIAAYRAERANAPK